jgi:hypothetical protein
MTAEQPVQDLRFTIVLQGRRYQLTIPELADEVERGRLDRSALTWGAHGGEVTTVGAVLDNPRRLEASNPTSHAAEHEEDEPASHSILATLLGVLAYPMGFFFLIAAFIAVGEGSVAIAMGLMLVGLTSSLLLLGVCNGLKRLVQLDVG